MFIIKTGLVLEGGGVRGIYTAGILDVFMENGLGFDGVVGVSAGAIHGCSFLSGQKGRSIRYYKKYSGDPRFMSLRSFITTGDFVGVDFCYHELPEQLDVYDFDEFKRRGVPFYAVCTNVETGQAEYMLISDMLEQIDYIRASASLPYFSRIVEINGKKYLDGGCSDSIPVSAFQKMGYERNVVILTRHSEYRKKPEMEKLAKIVYRKYPAFIEALRKRHIVYNQTTAEIAEMEKAGSIFVIRPDSALDIGRLETDPEKIQKIYDIGRRDAEKHMESLKNWLGTAQA